MRGANSITAFTSSVELQFLVNYVLKIHSKEKVQLT